MSSEDEDSPLVALDSQKSSESLSIAEARHMVRTAFLIDSLNQLNELATNPDTKDVVRAQCHMFLVKFAEGADGTEHKFLKKLSPEVARRIAKLGVQKHTNRRLTSGEANGENEK